MAKDGGRGTLLMADMGLPNDEHGFPFQVVAVLAPGGRGFVGLELDGEGRPRAKVMGPDGHIPDPYARQHVPPEVERAAFAWWEEYRRAPES